ncbi:sensor histidine kinase [Methylobacterium sp. JK268]
MIESDPPVLILAPRGRDAVVARQILTEGGLTTRLCTGLPDLVAQLEEGSCAVVTEEALRDADRRELAARIAGQEPWSDYPFVLLTLRGTPPDARLMEALGNVTLLERPFHPATLVTAARFAVRARRRQRETASFLRERQQTAERQTLLIRELHHRVKNTLATVQALLGASARSATGVDEFYQSFSARVISLAKTHNLLTDDYWQMASLQEMLENELGPYNDPEGRRIALDGPPVDLTADLAVPTGMAIHELTTNAAKHGALSVPEGRIAVRWGVEAREGIRRLRLDWTERGGPPTRAPTRRGFGSTLLQRVLTMQCGADIGFDFAPAGLHFRMEAPLVETRTVPQY